MARFFFFFAGNEANPLCVTVCMRDSDGFVLIMSHSIFSTAYHTYSAPQASAVIQTWIL
jgi:hypothetical protein